MFAKAVLAASVLPLSQAAETVLGVYIFSRHGDRTAKITPPTSLTDLGYSEIYTSGTYFRNRYIAANATSQIHGIETDKVKLSQLTVSAPVDNVLQTSAGGFLQGLYPPVGPTMDSQTLRNGTVVTAPMDGFQIIPVQVVASGAASEDSAWLQGQTNCANAIVSSNDYYFSADYLSLLSGTQNFYTSLTPIIDGVFSKSQTSFKNAYLIFDYLNVGEIHNSTTESPALSNLTTEDFFQVRTLADTHEFSLAYNASEPIRAIAGATLAAQILQALNATVTAPTSNPLLNIQFGAYNSFLSFFGLANLTQVNSDFYGIVDYASTITFELVTNSSATPFPSPDEISVRFLFHNGTTDPESQPVAYPLFGSNEVVLPWANFTAGMQAFAIGDQMSWCQACGNSTGVCAMAASSTPSSSSSGSSTSTGSSGISTVVAGVIGAMVTLAVILGLEALIMLIAGLRLVGKKRANSSGVKA